MTHEFMPANKIEKSIVAAQAGTLTQPQFMQELLKSELFMPIQEQSKVDGLQTSQSAVPLTLTTDEGIETLILFTSPERAKNFLEQFPDYKGGLLAEFTWILEKIGKGHAISINPDLPTGLDMTPDMLNQLTTRE